MKIKLLLFVIVAGVVGYWFYKRQITGKTYEKGEMVSMSLEKLDDDIALNKAKYEGKRIMFEGYLGYADMTFSSDGDDKNGKGMFDEKVFGIGVYSDIPDIKDENQDLKILLPKTNGANGFGIKKSSGNFSNDDVVFSTNEKAVISYKDKVLISADVKYYCIDNFNSKSKDCDIENPVTKQKMLFYHLKNVRIDKK
jgi:hypothetical protein